MSKTKTKKKTWAEREPDKGDLRAWLAWALTPMVVQILREKGSGAEGGDEGKAPLTPVGGGPKAGGPAAVASLIREAGSTTEQQAAKSEDGCSAAEVMRQIRDWHELYWTR